MRAFKTKYSKINPSFYPVHGEKSTILLFAVVTKYIETFEKITTEAKTKKEAMEEMKALYRTWKQADFLLL